ncbi:MAG: type II toxin-antitoxin system Phd/YefM family antitoxin [Deltaproteobacteria bacterium]|nr:MAG: type II toxin-antitoxin system Phd/YefM family antitoxin [Deltaproteobacteria bacterium]
MTRMDSSKDIEPVTTLKRDAATLIERARKRSSPIVITQNGKATAVLQDIESYERQRRALLLLKLLARGEKDYEAGNTQTHAQVGKQIRKRLLAHREE